MLSLDATPSMYCHCTGYIICYTKFMTNKPLGIKSTSEVKGVSIETYFNDGVIKHFSRGETIVEGYDGPQNVYLIKNGFVKAYTITKAGQENLMLIHNDGEFIPLTWALDGRRAKGLFYQAMSDVTALKTSKEKLRSAMDENIWLAQEISRQLLKIVSAYSHRIETLGFRTARERLVSELLNLAEMFGEAHGDEILIKAPVTHQDIADSISMNRETASRALGLLFDEGLIKQVDHLFTVQKIHKLEDASG